MKKAIRTGIALIGLILATAASVQTADAKTTRFAVMSGEKIFDGRTGPWISEAILMDPKSQVEGTRHLAFYVSRLLPKTPILIREGSGTVTVTGPDGKTVTKNLIRMDGHFGADIALNKPGEYRFTVDVEAVGAKGRTTFAYAIR